MKAPSQIYQNPPEIFERLYIRSKQLISWMRKKMEIIEAYWRRPEKDKNLPLVSAGDIYYAQLGENIGSEIDKERPVLIFQTDDEFIRYSNMVIVIPLTSNMKIRPYRVQIHVGDISENIGLYDCSVMVQQIRSISKARLSTFNGKLCKEKLGMVAIEVNNLLNINSTPP